MPLWSRRSSYWVLGIVVTGFTGTFVYPSLSNAISLQTPIADWAWAVWFVPMLLGLTVGAAGPIFGAWRTGLLATIFVGVADFFDQVPPLTVLAVAAVVLTLSFAILPSSDPPQLPERPSDPRPKGPDLPEDATEST